MIQEYQIRVQPQIAYNEQNLASYLSKEKGVDIRTINRVRILRRSIDARQRQVMVNLKVSVYINELPQDDEYQRVEYPDVSDAPQVIVVGAGPGGLFAALHLIELGYRPVIVERGKDVRERKKDMAAISRNQCVDPESNYCLVKVAPVLTPTANSIRAARNVAMRRRSSTYSANTVPPHPFCVMPILISARTSCPASLRTCGSRFCNRAVRFTSIPR